MYIVVIERLCVSEGCSASIFRVDELGSGGCISFIRNLGIFRHCTVQKYEITYINWWWWRNTTENYSFQHQTSPSSATRIRFNISTNDVTQLNCFLLFQLTLPTSSHKPHTFYSTFCCRATLLPNLKLTN